MSTQSNPPVDGYAEWLRDELEFCERAFRNGVRVALIDAIALCKEAPAITPEWVLDAIQDTVVIGLQLPTGTGRSGNPMARYIDALRHLDRWMTVRHIRYRQASFQATIKRAKQMNNMKLAERCRPRINIGRSWDDAYRTTSVLLCGTFSQGSPEAIKKSYSNIEKGRVPHAYSPRTEAFFKLTEELTTRK